MLVHEAPNRPGVVLAEVEELEAHPVAALSPPAKTGDRCLTAARNSVAREPWIITLWLDRANRQGGGRLNKGPFRGQVADPSDSSAWTEPQSSPTISKRVAFRRSASRIREPRE